MTARAEITVRSGTWLYDNAVKRPVRIIQMSKDYWYDLAKADGLLDQGEKPQLNPEGFLYYVRFGDDGDPMSEGFKSCEDAVRWAENKAPISWNQPE